MELDADDFDVWLDGLCEEGKARNSGVMWVEGKKNKKKTAMKILPRNLVLEMTKRVLASEEK